MPFEPLNHQVGHSRCVDCGGSTRGEYYLLHNLVWDKTGLTDVRHRGAELCIDCVEKRIGRQLTPSDFENVPLNTMPEIPRSDRLASRMRQVAEVVDTLLNG